MARSLWPTIVLIVQLVVLAIVLTVSLILSARLFGHRLRISRIRPFTLHHPKYTHYSSLSIAASSVHLAFHIPRPSQPFWATLTVHDYDYFDTTCRVSIAQLDAKLWFFPLLFRYTEGSWATATLEDFRLLVFTSRIFPQWVERLRKNLVATILTGDVSRLDDFKTTVILGNATSENAVNGYAGPVEKPGIPNGEQSDEARASASAQGYHVQNWQARLYTFGTVDAQLRRSWVDDRGSFVMIAEESRWTKVRTPMERAAAPAAFWRQFLISLWYFPSDVLRICTNPTSTIDLYVPRADITFDDFRIRDAELVRQAGALVREHFEEHKDAWKGFMWDALVSGILTMTG